MLRASFPRGKKAIMIFGTAEISWAQCVREHASLHTLGWDVKQGFKLCRYKERITEIAGVL